MEIIISFVNLNFLLILFIIKNKPTNIMTIPTEYKLVIIKNCDKNVLFIIPPKILIIKMIIELYHYHFDNATVFYNFFRFIQKEPYKFKYLQGSFS